MKRKHGFTLVELLVVIAVIALLMSILMPVLRRANDQAKRILCANHIKNQLIAMVMYADSHNYKIPVGGGYWPWDVEATVTNQMLKNMGVDLSSLPSATDIPVEFSVNFYCPANAQQRRFRDQNWNYTVNLITGAGFRVLGYAYLWAANWNDKGNITTYPIYKQDKGADKTDPAKKWVTRMDMPQASDAELIVDATLSDPSYPIDKYPNGNFAIVTCGGNGNDSTSHLIDDTKPAGGNIGFADNHVEWRPFTDMNKRFVVGGGTDGCPRWWW
jgi:prepilin-type N-terminal cleavage/methylation domain-containing protein/prepilin-type processing-associated H-X9-DG protein